MSGRASSSAGWNTRSACETRSRAGFNSSRPASEGSAHLLLGDQLLEVPDGTSQAFLQLHLRVPAQHLLRLLDVRTALLRIVLRQRTALDLGLRADDVDDVLRQLQHGELA